MAFADRVKSAAGSFGRVVGNVVRTGLAAYDAAVRSPLTSSSGDLIEKGGSPRPTGAEYSPLDAQGRVTEDGARSDIHPGTYATPQQTLERLARLSVPALVINYQLDEFAEFCEPQTSPHSFGFRITLDDDEAEPTTRQKRRMEDITKRVMNGGGKYQDGGFEGAVRRFMRNSLIQDAGAAQFLYERGGMPYGVFVYDSKTIRRRKPTGDFISQGQWGEDPGYVQWLDQRVRQEWDADEFMYGIRRPRSDLESFGYGFPELDELVNVLMSFARAETYNAVNFTSGVHASVLLAWISGMDREAFRAHGRNLEANYASPAAKRRVPVVQLDPELKEDIKAVQLGHNNREMEYSLWLYYLVKLICAIYGVDPAAALNMVFGNEGQSSSLNSSGPEQRYNQTKAHGIRPKLRFIARQWTRFVKQIDPDMKLVFGGFDSVSEQEKLAMDVTRLQNFCTVNEVRALYDFKPIDGPAGDMIANAIISQAQMQEHTMPGGALYTPPEEQDDAQLMNSLHRDFRGGGSVDTITKGLVGPYGEALRRGLIKPPPQWRPGKPWAALATKRPEPIIVEVRA